MSSKYLDFVVLPPDVDKAKVLEKIRTGFEYAILRREYDEDNYEVENFRIKHPEWKSSHKLFLAWMDRSENKKEIFLKLLKQLS